MCQGLHYLKILTCVTTFETSATEKDTKMSEELNPCCHESGERVTSDLCPSLPTRKGCMPTRDFVRIYPDPSSVDKCDPRLNQVSSLELHINVKTPWTKRRTGAMDDEENTILQERPKRLKIEGDYYLNKLQYETLLLRRATGMAKLILDCNDNHGKDTTLLARNTASRSSHSTRSTQSFPALATKKRNIKFQLDKDPQSCSISSNSRNALAPRTFVLFSFAEVSAMAEIFLVEPTHQSNSIAINKVSRSTEYYCVG
jgi:hypothetical protein